MNKEQMEAHEIDELPRIVITKENVYIYPLEGRELVLPLEELGAVKKLQELLRKDDSSPPRNQNN